MTFHPSSTAIVLCSLLLAACEVPPLEQAVVAPSETSAHTVRGAAAEHESLPANSASALSVGVAAQPGLRERLMPRA